MLPGAYMPPLLAASDPSITVNFIAAAAGTASFQLGIADPNAAIDWNTLESSLQPPDLSAAAWNAVFANFTSEVGNTMGGLQTALDNDANYLSQLGEYTPDPGRLLAFQLEQAGDFGAIAQRDTPGIFGLGVSDPTTTAVTDSEGNVEIVSGSTALQFTLLPDGSYQAAPGDSGTLTLANGIYQLREADGTLAIFNTDGSLKEVEDTDGDLMIYGYTGTRLTSITDAATGGVMGFAYNAQGLVNQITDPEGQLTTLGYDAAGHLLTVTAPEGTTSYTYVTSGTPQQLNALASVTNPDGSQVFYTYNSQGQLIGQSQNGGADPLTFSYDLGTISETNALGDTITQFFNEDESVVRVVDPLGNITQGS